MINYGEGVALGASLVCASTSLVLRTLSQHHPSALITAIRCGIAGPFFGPAKTATLTSATPVLSLILAVIFLKEQITLRLVTGIALCVAGVLLVL